MCKHLASSNYALGDHEDLDNVHDVRIFATMYSNNATNLYKACLAGVRRQKYWLLVLFNFTFSNPPENIDH
jgi:hypothetical protein